MNKILIIGPAWVGDMMVAQSLFRLLKQRMTDCSIDVVAPSTTYPLLERMPEVRKSWLLSVGHGELNLRARHQLAQALQLEQFTQAILLTNTFKSALVPFLAGIPKRTGWRGEWRYVLLNDMRVLDTHELPRMIQRFCALGLDKTEALPEKLPWPALCFDKTARAAVLKKFNISTDKPILALCPGAEYGPAKRWPTEHFATVARNYLQKGWQVWLFGGSKDVSLSADIHARTQSQCVDTTGRTSLLEAIDLLSFSQAVVSNDSGLMHVASALQRPLVVVYGSSDPRFTPPLAKPEHVRILSLHLSCSPCFRRECPLVHFNCLKQLMPSMVEQALDEMHVGG